MNSPNELNTLELEELRKEKEQLQKENQQLNASCIQLQQLVNDANETLVDCQTRYKKAEESLIKNEALYKDLFDSINMGFCVIEVRNEPDKPLDYRFLEINKAFEKQSSLGDAKGKWMRELRPDHEEYWFETYRDVALTGEPVQMVQKGRALEGRWFSISAFRFGEPELKRVVVLFNDISERKFAEERLQEKEAVIESFFDVSPGILTLFDSEYNFIECDRNTARYFNVDRNQIKGRSITEISPYIANYLIPVMSKVIESGNAEENVLIEVPSSKNLNETGVLSVNFFPIPVNNGRSGCGITGIDITNLKNTQEKLESERELFESIFDNIPVFITIYDPVSKNFRLNKNFKQILGWSEEDVEDGNIFDKIFPDIKYREQVLENKHEQTGWKEYVVTAKNGTKIISNWAYQELSKGVKIGIGYDISNRIKAEQKLREKEQRLRGIFDHAAIGIAEIDAKTRYISVNNRLCQILGYTRRELLTKSVLEIIAPEDLEQSKQLFEKLFSGESDVFSHEKRYVKGDGTLIWVHVSVSAIRDRKHNFLRAISTVKNISERKDFEKALRDSEERFRLLADNIDQMAFIINNEGMPLWFNKRWFDFTGISLEEMQAGGHVRSNHPDHVDRVFQGLLKSLKNQTSWEEIYPMRRIDGVYRWFLTRAQPIFDSSGKATLWFGTSTDITEQRKIEEALRENKQRLEGMFMKAAIGIVEVDRENRFIEVNDRICKILDYTHEELIGKSVFDITAPEFLAQTEQAYKMIHNGEFDTHKYEKQYLRKDGTPVWVNVSLAVIRDTQGQILRFIGTIENITERKKVENALRQSELMFSTMFTSLPVCVSLSTPDGVIYKVNPACLEVMGCNSEKELIGKNSMELGILSSPEHRNKIREEFSKNGNLRNYEISFKNAAGVKKIINVNIDPVQIREQSYVLSTIEDITEQKRIENELKQKNEELTHFIYTVSHDLKSPLVTIKSFTAFIQPDIESNDQDALQRDINYIQNAADKMGNLLDELLELSRIGRKEVPKELVPMRDIAQQALDLVAGRISNSKVDVQFAGPPVLLFGHTQRLVQLYQNLIDNAVKFMGNQPNPYIEIGTSIERDRVILYVKDNGSGIDSRHKNKIFGLFEKLDTQSEGSGIGLALIKRIVEVHGGEIWFVSEGIGKGTTFYFTLENTQIIS